MVDQALIVMLRRSVWLRRQSTCRYLNNRLVIATREDKLTVDVADAKEENTCVYQSVECLNFLLRKAIVKFRLWIGEVSR